MAQDILHRFIDPLLTPWLSCPPIDLTRGQFLSPPSRINLGSPVLNISTRPDYKPHDEHERINEFNRQCFLFTVHLETLRHEPISRPTGYFYDDKPSHTTREKHAITTLCKIPSSRKSRNRLLPPRPRFTSPLSPNTPNTLLPGPPRRPIPLKRSRPTPMLITALYNAQRTVSQKGRNRLPVNKAPQMQSSNVNEKQYSRCEDGLKESWTMFSNDDWVVVEPGIE